MMNGGSAKAFTRFMKHKQEKERHMNSNITNGADNNLANTTSATAVLANQPLQPLIEPAEREDRAPSDVSGTTMCSQVSQAGTGGTSLPESAERWAKLMKVALRAKKKTIIG